MLFPTTEKQWLIWMFSHQLYLPIEHPGGGAKAMKEYHVFQNLN